MIDPNYWTGYADGKKTAANEFRAYFIDRLSTLQEIKGVGGSLENKIIAHFEEVMDQQEN